MNKDIRMQNFEAWIGKKEVQTDVANARSVAMMQALFNQADKQLAEVPHLYHWCYFLPIVNQNQLAEDGHPHKGDFLPPIPFPKRMWAGGRLQFLAPIQVGQKIHRESEITKVEFKQGKSGDLYFVTVKHSIYSADHLAIIEEHDIVYREASNQLLAPAKSASVLVQKPYSYKKPFPIDSVTLFRYSALTFNGHKIHYDRAYCMEKEGYPGLVVHGPLLATCLLHFVKQEHPDQQVATFNFRALKPVFDFHQFSVCGDIQAQAAELWIENANGEISMQATVTFKGE